MKTIILESERLLLRTVQETDVSEIFNCWMQNEEVSRYMWWKASDDIANAKEFVKFELDQIENEKWYRWIIDQRSFCLIIDGGDCNEDSSDLW